MIPSLSHTTFSNGSSNDPEGVGTREIVLIFILGLVIRLFACQYTFIVNPDGAYYIHQARAIYYGEWDSLTSCSIGFLSNYPFFIAGVYAIFHDWIVAAKSVSLFFGSITLIPLYFLFRRFFDKNISALSTLVFALIPVFVGISADVVRGPICWFFLTLGLYFFVKVTDKTYRLPLLLCCLSYLMASWARIEAILFVFITCLYLLAVPQSKKIEKFAFFGMPLAAILLIVLCGIIFYDVPLAHTLRLDEIGDKFAEPYIKYEILRSNLSELITQPLTAGVPHFLHKARHLIWLIALGTLVKYMISAYFYLPFIIFILGLRGIWQRIREDWRILYLSLIAFSVFILLYLHVIQTWMMFNRFWTIFMLACFLAIGFGLEKSAIFIRSRFHLKQSIALAILCFLILAVTLPKNLKPREKDKLVFKEIGEFILAREGSEKVTKIVKSLRTPNWTTFYANLEYEGAPCPMTNFGLQATAFEEMVFKNYGEFLRHMRQNGVRYFLWEERAWPKDGFNFLAARNRQDLKELGNWSHPDTGKLILFSLGLAQK